MTDQAQDAAASEEIVPDPIVLVPPDVLEPMPPIGPTRFFLALDAAGVVLSAMASDLDQGGAIEVGADLYHDACTRLGRCALLGDVLVDHTPEPQPVPLPIAVPKLGLIRALMAAGLWPSVRDYLSSDLDLLFQWHAASSIARSDPLTEAVIARFHLSDDQVEGLMLAAVTRSAA